ncbi:MAG: hypothetical protein ACLFR0_07980 [Alphaproteobacteria bacterium]
MPKEDRRIIFTFEEAYKAIYSLSAQKDIKKPPAGEVVKINKDENDDSVIYMHLDNKQEKWEQQRKLEYSRDFIAAALMLYCRGCGIPLPKSAKKSVVLGSTNIILRVEI